MENANEKNKQVEPKDATLKLHLKSNSGFTATATYKINATQWGQILNLLEGKGQSNA